MDAWFYVLSLYKGDYCPVALLMQLTQIVLALSASLNTSIPSSGFLMSKHCTEVIWLLRYRSNVMLHLFMCIYSLRVSGTIPLNNSCCSVVLYIPTGIIICKCDQILENHPYGCKWHSKYLAVKSSIQYWISNQIWLQ